MRLLVRTLIVLPTAVWISCSSAPSWAQDITTGLRGHWKLDETSGTTATDSSGQGANGSYSGSATMGVSGRFGTAIDFSGGGGTTDRVSLPHTVLNGVTHVTLSFWIRTTNTTYHAILSANNSSYDNEFYVFIDTGGLLKVRYKNGSNSVSWSLSSIYDGNWHHIVVTMNNSTDMTIVYQDSVSLGSKSVAISGTLSVNSGGLILAQDQDCVGGCFDSAQRLIGRLDQVRIYNRVLSAEDIEYLYTEDEPVLHWNLDETSGASAADSSGFGRTGTVVGTASWIAGRRRNGFDFNGSTKIEATTLLGQPTNFTLACWARIDSSDSSGADGVSVGDYLRLRLHNVATGGPRGEFYAGGTTWGTASLSTSYIGAGWHHFAVTFDDAANSLKLYVDGALAVTVSTTNSISWSGLGTKTRAGANGNTSTAYDLDGALDDVRVYNRALTSSEIIEIYGLVGHWKLNEASGTAVADSSGLGNGGTVSGTATWTTGARDNGFSAAYANGDDYITVTNTASLQNVQEDDYTIAMWFKPATEPPGVNFANDAVYALATKSAAFMGVGYANGRVFGLSHAFADGTYAQLWSSTVAPIQRFHHVAAVINRTSGTIKLYLNGQLDSTTTFTANKAAYEQGAAPWRLGINAPGAGSYRFAAAGVIDDARIYNRAIDADEVLTLYGLLGHWKFNEGSGTTVADSSGNSQHAAFGTGAPTWVTSGPYGNALEFNGANDAITNNNFTPPTEGTVSWWCRSAGMGATQHRIFGLGGDWEVRHEPNGIIYLDLGTDAAGGGFYTSPGILPSGQWRHFAAVYDCDDETYAIYVDGVLHKSGTSTAALSPQTAAKLSFGARTGATERFSGRLDDFRIYDRKLSQAEICDLYGLVGWYKFDETTGTVAADSSGLGNNGTYAGSPTLAVTSNGNAAMGTAVDFSGSNYVQVSGMFDKPTSISVSAWAKLDASDSNGAEVVSLGDHILLRLKNNSVETYYYNGSTWSSSTFTRVIAQTGWHHYSAVYDESGSYKLYVDGVEATSASLPVGISYAGLGSNTRIGSHGNGQSTFDFDGRIDDVRIYKRPISADEVFQLYRGSRIDGIKILQWVEAR